MVDLISICCLLAWSGCFANVRDCAARGFAFCLGRYHWAGLLGLGGLRESSVDCDISLIASKRTMSGVVSPNLSIHPSCTENARRVSYIYRRSHPANFVRKAT